MKNFRIEEFSKRVSPYGSNQYVDYKCLLYKGCIIWYWKKRDLFRITSEWELISGYGPMPTPCKFITLWYKNYKLLTWRKY